MTPPPAPVDYDATGTNQTVPRHVWFCLVVSWLLILLPAILWEALGLSNVVVHFERYVFPLLQRVFSDTTALVFGVFWLNASWGMLVAGIAWVARRGLRNQHSRAAEIARFSATLAIMMAATGPISLLLALFTSWLFP